MINRFGFTLVEMLITTVVATILLALAVPSYLSFTASNSILNASNQFATAVNYARMEAIRLGVPVGVCPAQTTAGTSCGSANNWTNGWIVFTDADANNQIGNSSDRRSVTQPLENQITVTTTSNIILYNNMGALLSAPMTLLISATTCEGDAARLHTITASGQLIVDNVAC